MINVTKKKTIKSVIAACLLTCLSTQVSFPMKDRAKVALVTTALIGVGTVTATGARKAYDWWNNRQKQESPSTPSETLTDEELIDENLKRLLKQATEKDPSFLDDENKEKIKLIKAREIISLMLVEETKKEKRLKQEQKDLLKKLANEAKDYQRKFDKELFKKLANEAKKTFNTRKIQIENEEDEEILEYIYRIEPINTKFSLGEWFRCLLGIEKDNQNPLEEEQLEQEEEIDIEQKPYIPSQHQSNYPGIPNEKGLDLLTLSTKEQNELFKNLADEAEELHGLMF